MTASDFITLQAPNQSTQLVTSFSPIQRLMEHFNT
jgi:hypothetical protein